MRCSCCNAQLSDYESTLRHAITKKFVELCSVCLKDTGIPLQVRNDLIGESDTALEDLIDDYEDKTFTEVDDDDYSDYWSER